MDKIELDILKSILRDHLDENKQVEILRDINKTLTEEEQERLANQEEKPPKVEKKTVMILTSMPHGFERKDLEALSGFITEIPVEDETSSIKASLRDVAEAYKATKKSKKNPANSLGDLFEVAPLKLFKETGILKKPKGPVEFIYCPNR